MLETSCVRLDDSVIAVENVAQTHMEFYVTLRKKDIMTVTRKRLQPEITVLSKISQPRKDKWHLSKPKFQILCLCVYVCNRLCVCRRWKWRGWWRRVKENKGTNGEKGARGGMEEDVRRGNKSKG